MKILGFVLIAVLTISYPFLIYFGLSSKLDVSVLAIAGGIIAITQFVFRSMEAKNNFRLFLPLTIGLVATYTMAYFLKDSLFMKFTPVLISLNFFIIFTASIIKPPSMVERFARIRFKDLPSEAIPYCRKVTFIWIAFFIGNGSVAFWTAFQDLKTWAFYNGFLAYILMGILFAAEFLYRTFFLKKKSSLAHSQ